MLESFLPQVRLGREGDELALRYGVSSTVSDPGARPIVNDTKPSEVMHPSTAILVWQFLPACKNVHDCTTAIHRRIGRFDVSISGKQH